MLLTSEQHTRIAAASKLSNPLEVRALSDNTPHVLPPQNQHQVEPARPTPQGTEITEIMTRPIKSEAMDAAGKLMLDLMDKHPGASENSLLELFQKVAKD